MSFVSCRYAPCSFETQFAEEQIQLFESNQDDELDQVTELKKFQHQLQ